MCATQCDAGDVRTTYCDPTTDLIHVLPTTSPSLTRSVLEITVTAFTIFGSSLARDMDANKNDESSREMEKRWSMHSQIPADGPEYYRSFISSALPFLDTSCLQPHLRRSAATTPRCTPTIRTISTNFPIPSVTRIYCGETRATGQLSNKRPQGRLRGSDGGLCCYLMSLQGQNNTRLQYHSENTSRSWIMTRYVDNQDPLFHSQVVPVRPAMSHDLSPSSTLEDFSHRWN